MGCPRFLQNNEVGSEYNFPPMRSKDEPPPQERKSFSWNQDDFFSPSGDRRQKKANVTVNMSIAFLASSAKCNTHESDRLNVTRYVGYGFWFSNRTRNMRWF